MNKCIYLVWRDADKNWNIVGKLLRNNDEYEFRYTKGSEGVEQNLLPNMPEHDKVYRSSELFSVFKNRLMPKSRPDYPEYLQWLDIGQSGALVDDLNTLAVSGGEKETDSFRVIPVPEKNEAGEYSFRFFANGLGDLDEVMKNKVLELQAGGCLYLVDDLEKKEGALGLSLCEDRPFHLAGYIPQYFAKTIREIKDKNGDDSIRINVLQVNKDAPIQMRLLCILSSPFLSEHLDLYDPMFKVIIGE